MKGSGITGNSVPALHGGVRNADRSSDGKRGVSGRMRSRNLPYTSQKFYKIRYPPPFYIEQ